MKKGLLVSIEVGADYKAKEINTIDYIESLSKDYLSDLYKRHTVVSEGLVMTYPTRKLIQGFQKIFNTNHIRFVAMNCPTDKVDNCNISDAIDTNFLDDSDVKDLDSLEDSVFDVIKFVVPDNSRTGEINRLCSTLGYVQSNYESDQGTIYTCSPKFDDKSTINGKLPRYLYHVTVRSNEHKILERGFVPSNKKELSNITIADYEPRVYFFIEYNLRLFLTYAINSEHKSKEYDKDTNELIESRDFTIFTIDTEKIPDYVKFHIDLDFENFVACWTSNAISPEAIVDTKHIKI